MAVRALAFLTIVLILASAPLAAEPESPGPPDPIALSADWWSYYQPEEKLDATELATRLSESSRRFSAMLSLLDPDMQARVAPQISRINEDLTTYANLKNASKPADATKLPVRESYSIDEALERFSQWYQLNQEVAASKENLDWLKTVYDRQAKYQSKLKAAYFQLKDDEPARFEQGVKLIAGRLQLEIKRLELSQRRLLHKRLQEQLDHLQVELDAIPARLAVTAEDRKKWQAEAAAMEKAIARLALKIEAGAVVAEPVTALDTTMVQAQLQFFTRMEQELKGVILELRQAKAALVLSLLDIIEDPAQFDSAARTALSDYQELTAQLEQQRQVWTGPAQRGQRTAYELIAATRKADASLRKLNAMMLASQQSRQVYALESGTADYVARILEARLTMAQTWYERSIGKTVGYFSDGWGLLGNIVQASLFEVNETPVTIASITRFFVILIIAWWASKIIRGMLLKAGQRRGDASQSTLYTLGRIVHYVALTIGIIIGLSSIGLDLTKFALFASALGVGIGFGLQNLISNFVSGLIILFEKSLKIGDFVELQSGLAGEVKEINIRSTLITTNDNIDILVPNADFVSSRVTNWTLREANRRMHIPFGVAYGSDKELVRKAVLEAAYAVTWTQAHEKSRLPQVWLVQFGDSSLNFELVVWLKPEAVKRPGSVQASYLWEIDSKLGEYGIEIPFPQRDLHLRSVFGEKDEAGLAAWRETSHRP